MKQNKIVLVIILICAFAKVNAQNVDLVMQSMGPLATPISVGQTTQIITEMTNLGPDDIPATEATLSLTLSRTNLRLGNPLNFTDNSGRWVITFIDSTTNPAQYNMFFANSSGAMPVGDISELSFDVVGRAIGSNLPIGNNSSLSPTGGSSEANTGNNSLNPPPTVSVIGVLSIKLNSFEATIKDCNAVLNWNTSSEENFSRYEIEFSENGRAYSKVGTVNGKNELNTVSKYQFIYNQLNSKGYYRLKMIDKDGKINYSKTILLLNKCADRLVSIYPSPINSNQIASVIVKNLKGKIIGELYGLDGKIVDGFIFNNGTNKMGVSKLAAGAYYLKVKDAEGFTQSLRVIVVRGQ